MSEIEIHQVPVLRDNFVYLLREPKSKCVGIVDPAVAGPVMDEAKLLGWRVTHILNTHHHNDHTGGNLEIKERTGCTIVGPQHDRDRIPGIDLEVKDSDIYKFGNEEVQIFFVPGHTRGHIAYWFKASNALFCGDTLFSIGCGRLFEGTPDQMWKSLSKLRTLPPQTRIYCAHEYTEANIRFAVSIDPNNQALRKREKQVTKLRSQMLPTVPSTLGMELAANPFLRADQPGLQEAMGMLGADPVEVFAEVRHRKDVF